MRYQIFTDPTLDTDEHAVAVPLETAQAVHVTAGRVLLPCAILEAGSAGEALFRYLDQVN